MSEKKRGMDMTVGDPMRLLVKFAIPLLIGAVFQLMYNMVDTIVVGRFVSAEALAAVGATGSTVGLIIMVGNALTNGMSILISQAWGAKDYERVRRITGISFVIALAASVVIGMLSFALARPLMNLLGTPENIIDGSVQYVRIVCGMFVALMFYNSSAAVLRAIGDSKTPLMFLILCSLMNIVLDLLFVWVFENGIASVAWATVISQFTSAALCCAYMWRKYSVLRFGAADMQPDHDLLGRYARISLPMMAQNIMLMAGQMVITGVINSFGSDIVAAFTVGNKVEQLVTVIVSQVAFSFSVYSGQNYGAKLYDRINLGINRALMLLSVMTAAAMAVLFGFGRPLALLFVKAEETKILESALEMLRVEACFMPALVAIWLYNSALRGMGLIKPTVISGMMELAAKVGFSVVLSQFFGPIGIWFASPLGWVIGLAQSGGYFYFGKWKQKALAADMRAAHEGV